MTQKTGWVIRGSERGGETPESSPLPDRLGTAVTMQFPVSRGLWLPCTHGHFRNSKLSRISCNVWNCRRRDRHSHPTQPPQLMLAADAFANYRETLCVTSSGCCFRPSHGLTCWSFTFQFSILGHESAVLVGLVRFRHKTTWLGWGKDDDLP